MYLIWVVNEQVWVVKYWYVYVSINGFEKFVSNWFWDIDMFKCYLNCVFEILNVSLKYVMSLYKIWIGKDGFSSVFRLTWLMTWVTQSMLWPYHVKLLEAVTQHGHDTG